MGFSMLRNCRRYCGDLFITGIGVGRHRQESMHGIRHNGHSSNQDRKEDKHRTHADKHEHESLVEKRWLHCNPKDEGERPIILILLNQHSLDTALRVRALSAVVTWKPRWLVPGQLDGEIQILWQPSRCSTTPGTDFGPLKPAAPLDRKGNALLTGLRRLRELKQRAVYLAQILNAPVEDTGPRIFDCIDLER